MRNMPTLAELEAMSVEELEGYIREYDTEVQRIRGNMREIQNIKGQKEHEARRPGDPTLAQTVSLNGERS